MADRNYLPWRDRRARQGGTHGKLVKDGSSFIDINWDSVQARSTGRLAVDDIYSNEEFKVYRDLLLAGNLSDKDARTVRALERQAMDTLLADRRSWCDNCLNVLHNCHCGDDLAARVKVSEAGVQLIHRLRQGDVDRKEALLREEKLLRRKAYREAKKNRKGN